MTNYDPNGCFDVWKENRLVGRLLTGSFYAAKRGGIFNFNRVDGGLEGDLFVYQGKPCARLIGNEIHGNDGTVLRLTKVPVPVATDE